MCTRGRLKRRGRARMVTAMTMSRVEQWERRSEVPMLLLAVAFLVTYVWPVLDPVLNRTAARSLAGRANRLRDRPGCCGSRARFSRHAGRRAGRPEGDHDVLRGRVVVGDVHGNDGRLRRLVPGQPGGPPDCVRADAGRHLIWSVWSRHPSRPGWSRTWSDRRSRRRRSRSRPVDLGHLVRHPCRGACCAFQWGLSPHGREHENPAVRACSPLAAASSGPARRGARTPARSGPRRDRWPPAPR